MHRLVKSSRQLSLKSLMLANARYDRHLEKFVGDVTDLSPTAKFTVRDNCMARSAHSLCGAAGQDVNDDNRDHRNQGGGVKLQVLSDVHDGDGECVIKEHGQLGEHVRVEVQWPAENIMMADSEEGDADDNLTVLCIGMAGGCKVHGDGVDGQGSPEWR
jgi:hypothetical protein